MIPVIDRDSIDDLLLYLASGRNAVHVEMRNAVREHGRHSTQATAWADAWVHLHHAYGVLTALTFELTPEKD